MFTPGSLEHQHTLTTAVGRYNELRTRDTLASAAADMAEEAAEDGPGAAPLPMQEALEMLALGEVIARKAGYGRQLGVRSARAAGASWSQIGAALGMSKQSAWEAHSRWIDQQVEQRGRTGYVGLGEREAAAARKLAGTIEDSSDNRDGSDSRENRDSRDTGVGPGSA